MPNQGFPPFYDSSTISHYHLNSPLNIAILSTKDWYRVLLEDNLLMSQPNEDAPPSRLPTRVEALSPENDWPETWRLSRICGLESRLTTFLFKLLHHLLPTQDRVHRIGVADGDRTSLVCVSCAMLKQKTHSMPSSPVFIVRLLDMHY